jgi:hypothetical protein
MFDFSSPADARPLVCVKSDPHSVSEPTPIHDIFISYAHEDQGVARELVKVFEKLGWSTFIDRDIAAGQDYADVIACEVETARCVVVIWSSASVQSYWVRGEAQRGLERGLVVPVVIERVRLPLPFNALESIELLDWPSNSSKLEVRRLMVAVGHAVNQSELTPKQLPFRDDPTMSMRIEKRVLDAFNQRERAAGELESMLRGIMHKALTDPQQACADLVAGLQEKLSCRVLLDDGDTTVHRAPKDTLSSSLEAAEWQLVVQAPGGSLTLTCLGDTSPSLDLKVDVLRQVLERLSLTPAGALLNLNSAR